MMKNIISVLLISLVIFCFPVIADSGEMEMHIEITQTIDSDTQMVNQNIGILGTTIEGMYNKVVTIGIIEKELDKSISGNYAVLKQVIVDSDGKFEIDIPFQIGGIYIIRVGGESLAVPVEYQIETVSVEIINNFIDGIRNTFDKTDFKDELLLNGEALGFKMSIFNMLSSDKQEQICEATLIESRLEAIDVIKSNFDKNCALLSVSNQNNPNIILNSFEYYSSFYNFQNDSIYNVFLNGNESLKKYTLDMVGKASYSDIATLKKNLYDYAVFYDIFDITIESELITKINQYDAYINVNNIIAFNNMTLNKKINVAGFLYHNKGINLDEFNDKFTYILNNYNTVFPDSNNDSGSGSGSKVSSGGRINISIGTNKEESAVSEATGVNIITSLNDLQDVEWAKEAILSLFDKKAINGKEQGKFYPNDSITRGEFIKILMVDCGITNDNVQSNFIDVPTSHWAYDYVTTAYKNGFIKGISQNEFGVNNIMTREDMTTLGYRIISYFGNITGKHSLENNFIDFNDISDYAKNSILMLNEYGIINGYPDNTFKPKNSVTRAEAAQFIYNIIEKAI